MPYFAKKPQYAVLANSGSCLYAKLASCAEEELAVLKDQDLVDCMIRSMDNPSLRDPIRRVLQRIGTPEARAAVGEDRTAQSASPERGE